MRRSGRWSRLAAAVVVVFAADFARALPTAHAVDTDMAISMTAVDFGPVPVGTTGPPIAVMLTNAGGDPFGPINIFGGAPPTDEFDATQNCQAATLPAGGSCHVTFTFSPTTPGSFNDTWSFTISETASQSDGEDFSVALSGVGASALTATPLAHDFGTVEVGTTSGALVTVITNSGTSPLGPLNIFGGAPTAPAFAASQNCQGVTLAPSAICQVSYTFTPPGTGSYNDTSTFAIGEGAEADATPFAVSLTGSGAPPATTTTLAPTTTLAATTTPAATTTVAATTVASTTTLAPPPTAATTTVAATTTAVAAAPTAPSTSRGSTTSPSPSSTTTSPPTTATAAPASDSGSGLTILAVIAVLLVAAAVVAAAVRHLTRPGGPTTSWPPPSAEAD